MLTTDEETLIKSVQFKVQEAKYGDLCGRVASEWRGKPAESTHSQQCRNTLHYFDFSHELVNLRLG